MTRNEPKSIGKRAAAAILLSGAVALAGLGLASGTAQADPDSAPHTTTANDIKIGNRSQFVQSGTTSTGNDSGTTTTNPPAARPQTLVFMIERFSTSNH